MGNALAQTGRLQEAIGQFQEALRLRLDFSDARSNLEVAQRLLTGQHGGTSDDTPKLP